MADDDEFCGSCGQPVHEDGSAGHHEAAPSGSNRTPVIVVGVVVIAALIAVVAFLLLRGGDEGDETASPSAAASMTPTVTESPKPGKTKPGDARLEGTYRLDLTGLKSNVDGVYGSSKAFVYELKPRCDEGPCDTEIGTDPGILLSRDGASYAGGTSAEFGSTCNGEAIDSEASFVLRATKAKDGAVTRLVGKLRVSVPAQKGCSSANSTYEVEGRNTTKSASAGSGVPSVSLTNYPPLDTPYGAANYFFQSWKNGDRDAALWAGDAKAVNFLFGIAKKDYRLTCSGLGYLGGTNCGLLLHKQKYPIIIFQLRTNDDPKWKVKYAYWNAD